MSRRRNEPTIERAVDAARPIPSSIELVPLLLEILTGFVSAQIFTANFNSATSASHGVTCNNTPTKYDHGSLSPLLLFVNSMFAAQIR